MAVSKVRAVGWNCGKNLLQIEVNHDFVLANLGITV